MFVYNVQFTPVLLCVITIHEIHVIALNKNSAPGDAVFYELVTSFTKAMYVTMSIYLLTSSKNYDTLCGHKKKTPPT